MNEINNTSLRSAWSIEPEKGHLKEYLDAPTDESIICKDGKEYKVSTNFKKDFMRLEAFVINGIPVFPPGEELTSEDAPRMMRRVSLLLGRNEPLVQKVTNLIFQGITADAYIPYFQKVLEVGYGALSHTTPRRLYSVDISKEEFRITHEFLYHYQDAEDSDISFYVKNKLLIKGATDDLLESNVDKMTYKAYYTAISPTRSGVEGVGYGGFWNNYFNADLATTF